MLGDEASLDDSLVVGDRIRVAIDGRDVALAWVARHDPSLSRSVRQGSHGGGLCRELVGATVGGRRRVFAVQIALHTAVFVGLLRRLLRLLGFAGRVLVAAAVRATLARVV